MIFILLLLVLLRSPSCFGATPTPTAPTLVTYADTSLNVAFTALTDYPLVTLEMSQNGASNFVTIYFGAALTYTAKFLTPLTTYRFRIKLSSADVSTGYSPISVFATSGQVKSIAGNTLGMGWRDGSGSNAFFTQVRGMDMDVTNGDIYLADMGNAKIRIVDVYGLVTTLSMSLVLQQPYAVCLDPDNNGLFIADSLKGIYYVSLTNSTVTQLLSVNDAIPDDPSAIPPRTPMGIRYDPVAKVLYFSENSPSALRSWPYPFSSLSTIDTLYTQVGSLSWSFVRDPILSDFYIGTSTMLVLIDGTSNTHSILAGSGSPGDKDGPNALFERVEGVALDASGAIYVADYGNSVIRKVTPDGNTTTVAGSPQSSFMFSAGVGPLAQFCNVAEIFQHPTAAGYYYVADSAGLRILYGATPPAPRLHVTTASPQTLWIMIDWEPLVPSIAITSCTVQIELIAANGSHSVIATNTANTWVYGMTLPYYDAQYQVSVFTSNEYGNGDVASTVITAAACPIACGFGQCNSSGVCVCQSGYGGPNCDGCEEGYCGDPCVKLGLTTKSTAATCGGVADGSVVVELLNVHVPSILWVREFDLTHRWELDGSYADEYSSIAVTPQNNTAFSSGGVCDQALHVPQNSYATIPGALLATSLTNNFTIAFWVRIASIAGAPVILSQRSSACTDTNFWMFNVTNQKLQFQFGAVVAWPDIVDIRNDVWYHIAATKAGNTLSLYLNGTSVRSFNVPQRTWNAITSNIWIASPLCAPSGSNINARYNDLIVSDTFVDPSLLFQNPCNYGIVVGNTNIVQNLPAATYMVTATDLLCNISITAYVNITEASRVVLNNHTTPATCRGSANGALSVNFSGPHDEAYSWYYWQANLSTWQLVGNGNNITNLYAGKYYVDSNGCMPLNFYTEVTEPAELQALDAYMSCHNTTDCNITLTVYGGKIATIYYAQEPLPDTGGTVGALNATQGLNTIAHVPEGKYFLVVYDSACSGVTPIELHVDKKYCKFPECGDGWFVLVLIPVGLIALLFVIVVVYYKYRTTYYRRGF